MSDEQRHVLQEIEPLLETGDRQALRESLGDAWSSDIAEVVEILDNEQRRLIFDVLDTPMAAEVLEKVNEATRTQLFELLGEQEIQRTFSELDYDAAADLLAEMPQEIAGRIVRSLPPSDRLQITELMRYSADSAGGIMDPVVISVHEDATVAEAVAKIRAAEIDEDFYSVYVVDKDDRFMGEVRLRLLLTRPETTRIGELVDHDAIHVTTDMDQEEVRNIFRKNNLIVAPVLGRDHRLVGRITADRVIEVAEEEAAEDLYTMAGTDPDELETFSAIMVSTTLGLLLPFLFRKVGIDPAISSGPLVTTANDSISVAIYMTLAVVLAS